MLHEHHQGCGHMPEPDMHHHEHAHNHAEHIGQLCLRGQCAHPEHAMQQMRFEQFQQALLHEQMNSTTPELKKDKNKEKAKKKQKIQPLLSQLFARTA